MNELLDASLSAPSIVPTILLMLVLLYWFSTMIGLVDLSTFDIHLDVDKDINVDKDIQVQKHIELKGDSTDGSDSSVSVTWLNSVLTFFNLGHVPFMVFLSFLVLPMWIISLLANYFLGNTSGILGTLLLLPNLFVSLFIAKILTTPFVKIFAALNKEDNSQQVILGKVCTLMIAANDEAIGQASVKINGAPLMLNVKTSKGTSLEKGKTALIIDYHPESKSYLIEPYEM